MATTRPRREGVNYNLYYTVDCLQKPILTLRRKDMIMEFKNNWKKKSVGSPEWIKSLGKFIQNVDKEVQFEDVKRWIATHSWIIDPKGVPPQAAAQAKEKEERPTTSKGAAKGTDGQKPHPAPNHLFTHKYMK